MTQSRQLPTAIQYPAKVSPRKRKLAGFAPVTLLLLATNPSQKTFSQWASSRMANKIQSVCGSSLIPFRPLARSLCQSLALSSHPLTTDMINRMTDRQNLLLFSIYTTQTPGLTFTTLGGMGHFVTLSVK